MSDGTPDGKQAIVKRDLEGPERTYDAVNEAVETDDQLILHHTDGSTSVEYVHLLEYHRLGHDVDYHPLANSGRALDAGAGSEDDR